MPWHYTGLARESVSPRALAGGPGRLISPCYESLNAERRRVRLGPAAEKAGAHTGGVPLRCSVAADNACAHRSAGPPVQTRAGTLSSGRSGCRRRSQSRGGPTAPPAGSRARGKARFSPSKCSLLLVVSGRRRALASEWKRAGRWSSHAASPCRLSRGGPVISPR